MSGVASWCCSAACCRCVSLTGSQEAVANMIMAGVSSLLNIEAPEFKENHPSGALGSKPLIII